MRQRRQTGRRLGAEQRTRQTSGPARVVGLLTATVVSLVILAPALAGATPPGPWVMPATELSTEQLAGYPEIAFAPDGSATAVWGSHDGVEPTLQVATRPPGGSFGTPVELATVEVADPNLKISIEPDGATVIVWRHLYNDSPAQNNIRAAVRPAGESNFGPAFDLSPRDGTNASWPEVGSGPDGTTVIWSRNDGSNQTIHSATRPTGGTFTAPERISTSLGISEEARLAVGPDGTDAVVWRRPVGGKSIIQATTRAPGESAWSPANLSEPIQDYDVMRPRVAVGPDGTVTAVWHLDDQMSVIVQSATLDPGKVIWDRVNLSQPGQHSGHPWIAFAPDGTATAVWIRQYEDLGAAVQAATRPPGGEFGVPVVLSAPGGATNEPQVGFAPDGTTVASWLANDGAIDTARAATREPGANSWSTENLSDGSTEVLAPAQLAFARDGSTVAIWVADDGLTKTVQSATRPDGGSFGAPVNLSPFNTQTGMFPRIASAPDGTGITTAVWTDDDEGRIIVQTASTATPTLTLAVSRSGSGTGTVVSGPAGIECGSACDADLPAYTEITLTAAATEGSVFTGWDGACSGSGATCQLRMDHARNVTATFTDTTGPTGPPGPPGPPDPLGPPVDPGPAGVTATTAVFDGKRLHVRLKCGLKFKPRCNTTAVPVTRKDRKVTRKRKQGKKVVKVVRMVKGKPMAKPVKKKIKSGKWIKVSFLITPRYRAAVRAMSKKTSKTLYVQQKIRSKKIGRKKFKGKKPRIAYHRYRVRSTG